MSALLTAIETQLSSDRGFATLDAPILTRARHHVAVARAISELRLFLTAWRDDMLPASVSATHVRAAGDVLSELIGVVYVDDVLEVVFRTFCVGK